MQEQSTLDANKALVRRWFEEVWNKWRAEAIDEMFAADGIAHGLSDDAGNSSRERPGTSHPACRAHRLVALKHAGQHLSRGPKPPHLRE
jgi:hypothetical protein